MSNSILLNFPKFNRFYGASVNDDGVIFTVHELGICNLKEKIFGKKPVDPKTKHCLTEQLLQIINQLHISKIVHRDLKPANFLIMNERNDLQICDFGTIRKLSKDTTTTLNQAYTIQYAPPEFVLQKEKASLASDIWSLGIIIYEIYYSKPFWEERKNVEIERFLKENQDPHIKLYSPEVPSQIQEIIREAVRFDRHDRMKLKVILLKFDEIENEP